jgi:hypothetical protein
MTTPVPFSSMGPCFPSLDNIKSTPCANYILWLYQWLIKICAVSLCGFVKIFVINFCTGLEGNGDPE